MASYVDQATLLVKDSSTAQIKKINAALRKLFETAKALKSIKIDIKVNDRGITQAIAKVQRLKSELNSLKTAGNINIKANATQLTKASQAARQLQTALRGVQSTTARVNVNTAGISGARGQLNALRAAARHPIAVTTRGGGGAMVPPGGGFGGRGLTGPGRFGRGLAGGFAGGGYGESIGHATGRAIGRATREGINDADIADTLVAIKQLPPEQMKAIDQAARDITAEQAKTPSGAMLNVAQIKRFLAESLPVAKGDIEGAKALTREMITMTKLGVGAGRDMERSRLDAIQYSKAVDQLGVMFDRQGKLIPDQAQKWFGTFRKIMPDIGEEMTGPFARAAVKYAGVARYGMDERALANLLFMGEEFGASSAGVKMREAVRSLSAIRITDAAAINLSRLGLISPEEAVTARKGRPETGRVGRIIGGPGVDEELKQQNVFEWINRKMMPAYEADLKRRGKAMESMEPAALQADMAKFVAKIGFAANAADLIAAAMIRAPELKLQVDQALARSGEREATEKSLAESTRVRATAMQTQIQSVLGQAFNAMEPILLPAMSAVSGGLQQMADTIQKAGQGDKDAQRKLAGGAALAAVSAPALAGMAAAAGAVAAPTGMITGMAAAATAPTMAGKSLGLAGASLSSAAAALQAAAAAQMAAAGAPGLRMLKAALPLLGTAGAIALGATAESAGPGSPGYKYTTATEGERQRMRDLAAADTDVYNLTKQISDLQKEAAKTDAPAMLAEQVRQMTTQLDAAKAKVNQLATTEEERAERGLSAAAEQRKLTIRSGWPDEQKPIVLPPAPDMSKINDIFNTMKSTARVWPDMVPVKEAPLAPWGDAKAVPFVEGMKQAMAEASQQFTQVPESFRGTIAELSAASAVIRDSGIPFTAAASQIQTSVEAGAASFQSTFASGAQAITAAGQTAASTLQAGAPSAGAALGQAAVAAIQAGVSNLNINVNANVTGTTTGADTGSLKATK